MNFTSINDKMNTYLFISGIYHIYFKLDLFNWIYENIKLLLFIRCYTFFHCKNKKTYNYYNYIT